MVNGFLFLLNHICRPSLGPRLRIGTTLISIYLDMSSYTDFAEHKLAKVKELTVVS